MESTKKITPQQLVRVMVVVVVVASMLLASSTCANSENITNRKLKELSAQPNCIEKGKPCDQREPWSCCNNLLCVHDDPSVPEWHGVCTDVFGQPAMDTIVFRRKI
ncbi:hypothetical protein TIFTF001_024292 [Ficus carica]|uniref:Uncharacterized protein n=1 Tax=Ficus carica TaxID=3494 RepID=A0AA88DEK6_FICCA|nr:hypothetical protein TIFTF001_024292 [Ficus carica]